jgi:hypothetical protein
MPTTSQKIWWCRESNPGLWICSQELLSISPQRRSRYSYAGVKVKFSSVRLATRKCDMLGRKTDEHYVSLCLCGSTCLRDAVVLWLWFMCLVVDTDSFCPEHGDSNCWEMLLMFFARPDGIGRPFSNCWYLRGLRSIWMFFFFLPSQPRLLVWPLTVPHTYAFRIERLFGENTLRHWD